MELNSYINNGTICTRCKKTYRMNPCSDDSSFCTECKFYAENGYLNFNFGNKYLINTIDSIAKRFDKIYISGEVDCALYDYKMFKENFDESGICTECKKSDVEDTGIRKKELIRYAINRTVSVCDMFDDNLQGDDYKNLEKNEIFRDVAVLCAYSNLAERNFKERTIINLAKVFKIADSCISNASMIYLNLYKACGYVLFEAFSATENNKKNTR